MDEPEEPEVTPQEVRRPICMDCRGHGMTEQPRAAMVRRTDGSGGMATTAWTLARCQACRGTGKAGSL